MAKTVSERIEEGKRMIDTPLAVPSMEIPKPAEPPFSQPLNGAEKMAKARAARAKRGNESKEQTLIRLANARVTKACKAIALVGNLAAYKPQPHEIAKIEQALGESCASVMNRLNGTRRDSITFNLR